MTQINIHDVQNKHQLQKIFHKKNVNTYKISTNTLTLGKRYNKSLIYETVITCSLHIVALC